MPVEGEPREGGDDIGLFLARIRAGDEDAARELLARYESEVRLVVRRQLPKLLRSRFDSLDFLQSVWGDFFQRIRSGPAEFTDSRHLVGFLARAAKNKVIDEYRRAASQKQDMQREEPIWSGEGSLRELAGRPESPSLLMEAAEAYDKLCDLLPEDRRNVLALKAQGLSAREIGEQLGISERTVQRVLEDLRRRAQGDQTGDGES